MMETRNNEKLSLMVQGVFTNELTMECLRGTQ